MLVDSHCHLDYPDYDDEGLEAVLKRAKEQGVEKFLTISTNLVVFDKVLAVAKKFPDVYCTVGTHPHHADEAPEIEFSREDIVKLTHDKEVVGVGETGLDYFYEHSPKEEQKQGLVKHIEAALETDLPLVVHTRDADADIIDILKSAGEGKLRGVVHCFSGDENLARAALDLGFYISVSGIITFKTANEIREALKYVPMDRLMVETDCPYLAPVPYRGKRNEPAYVTHTAMTLSEIKEVSIDEVANVTTQNFFDLFSKISI